jgi:ferredoxin
MKKRRNASPASRAGARYLTNGLLNMRAAEKESDGTGIVAARDCRKNHADKALTLRVESLEMANAPDVAKAPGMVPDEQKHEPRSKGIATARKKKPKELAVITECCTGCAGSPACVEYCPVEDCMFWVPDEDNPPFGRIQIDPILCIGCKKCLSKGPDGCFLDGCPWDAIVMVDTAEVEKEVGPMAY